MGTCSTSWGKTSCSSKTRHQQSMCAAMTSSTAWPIQTCTKMTCSQAMPKQDVRIEFFDTGKSIRPISTLATCMHQSKWRKREKSTEGDESSRRRHFDSS